MAVEWVIVIGEWTRIVQSNETPIGISNSSFCVFANVLYTFSVTIYMSVF